MIGVSGGAGAVVFGAAEGVGFVMVEVAGHGEAAAGAVIRA